MKSILIDTESVGLFSDTNLEIQKKREQADIFSRHITCGMRVGLLLVSSSWFSRTCILKPALAPRFCFVNITEITLNKILMGALKIKHVADLLTMHFNIPSYQRGYRWEKKHVEALLDDLYNFWKNTERGKGGFYCLQPLVVVKNQQLSENETVYDVIDGQQRLTTLYLLLIYLSEARKLLYGGSLSSDLFSIKYESRDSGFFINKEFRTDDIDVVANNVDFFYMTMAYNTIKSWFASHESAQSSILEVLIPRGYYNLANLPKDKQKTAEEENDRKNDARFIWYEITPNDKVNSIEVFSQLNYGKTPLTPSELVKAQVFQCDLYGENEKVMKEVAFRRSCEWDMMEKQLQDPFMWSMLASSEDYMPSRMDFILSFVFENLYADMKCKNHEFEIDREADDFIYQVCSLYLDTDDNKIFAERTNKIWTMVQSTYTVFYNWYRNTDFYHLTGLLVWLKEYKNRNFGISDRRNFIRNLMEEYGKRSKQDYIDYLESEIARIVRVPETKKEGDDEMPWGISRINYNENPLSIVRILVLFNVEVQRLAKNEGARFPFHLLRKFNITSLEHIHPQNLATDNIKLDTLEEWLETKENNLKELNKYEEYKNEICLLKELLKDEYTYKENYERISELIDIIDKEFDDLAGMSESQMHTLYNLALVDRDTNSALSNNLIDKKRQILIQRQNDGETYVMPATMMVFNKYFSDNIVSPKLWIKQDREAYFNAINNVYSDFIAKLQN